MTTDKLSKYNIEVEHEKFLLLYNGLSDRLMPISYDDYAVVETLMENLDEFQKFYPDLYAQFKDAGFIIDGKFDELAFIKLQNKKKTLIDRNYHITINPTLDCNLRCWYCSVEYAGAEHFKERMSEETLQGLKNHVGDLIKNNRADSILLDWFGGEPMMYYDEVIKPLAEYVEELNPDGKINIRQQMTTNATLFNRERILEMRDWNFTFFQITFDGNREHHDKIKFYADKGGTYDDIVRNVNMITELMPNTSVFLRINYDKQTLKHITELFDDLSQTSKQRVTFDFQKVWQVKTVEDDKELLMKTRADFGDAGMKCTLGTFKPMTFKKCYADSINHYVINFDGKVYKCTARDYKEDKCLGQLHPSGQILWDDNIRGKYFEKATFENEMCEGCSKLPFCMGPCIQHTFDSRTNNSPVQCMLKDAEYNVTNWIVDLAKGYGILE